MASLREFLIAKGYTRIRLFPTITHHLELKAAINGVEGSFILDTGASSSCVDVTTAAMFHLEAEASELLAAGAGASDMPTEAAHGNELRIGSWQMKDLHLVLFDLSHVNQALDNYEADTIHGILGADFLNKGKGIIDYQYHCLYLK